MAQTIWIHKLAEQHKAAAGGMEYICEHIFKGLMLTGKLTRDKGWNAVPDAGTKEGAAYRALLCDSCAKNHNHTNVRMAKEPAKEPALV